MLGNDVVDLLLAKTQSNWRRKNYLAKVFTDAEQQEIWEAENPDLMVWLLWSMKEAAYKILNRSIEQRFYNPKAFACQISKLTNYSSKGLVCYDGKTFYSNSKIHNDCVHTIALSTQHPVKTIKSYFGLNQANYVELFNQNHQSFRLQKNNQGIPEMLNLCSKTKSVASISHHGKYLFITHL
ncbi:hypothetical protein DHW03_13120 [Pedobacter yonginense]|uniref:4'-phosphopantetheinyl transferase domain-containing protein n=1 Tax=Pedobacter yonginense TaxID=651869 RepID=A0A317ELB9_9SPHI|nr:4'-phosphopantetheinyl transferase superfamily protein [Pedobacter yonginense]PWS26957.1 hypothetical protein DHW03_13120 [Pedobacter yonginense]